jgi:hypothetical protein
MAVGWKGARALFREEAAMRIGDYPVSGTPYWLTMTGVVALGLVGVVLMLAVQ